MSQDDENDRDVAAPSPEWVVETLNQAAQMGQAGRLTEAVTLCQQILQHYPNTPRAYQFLGLAALKQGQPQQALVELERAIALDPTLADFHNHAGVAHFTLGNFESGILCYQRAVALQPDSVDMRYNLALGLQKLNRLDEAAQQYEQILLQDPNHVPSHLQLGQIHQQQAQWQEAIAHYQTITTLQPTYTEAWAQLGALWERQGDRDAAKTAYQQVLSLDPLHKTAQAALFALLSSPSQDPPERPLIPSELAIPQPQERAEREASGAILCHADDGFQAWLSQAQGSLLITTYQANKLVMISWNGETVMALLRHFQKPMGIAVQGHRLALATQHEVTLFANAPVLAYSYLENQPGRYDALYLPRTTYFTGDLHLHDLAFGGDQLWMVNTRFSCLATLSDTFNFVPTWQPPFITELVPEDRCHLNGVAIANGQPRYVTALGETDEVGGWRSTKANGGILIDVVTGEVVLRGLSMPHSPRWHQGQLWFLNSGTGELWRFDPDKGDSEIICALPGFGRGLYLVGDYALIGLSQIRETHIFGDLPLQKHYDSLRCGVAVVHCQTGEWVGTLEFTSGCRELGDIAFLPEVQRPTLLTPDKPATRDAFTAPETHYWLRPSSLKQP